MQSWIGFPNVLSSKNMVCVSVVRFQVNANWVTRKQRFVPLSTCEAEVAAVANTTRGVDFIRDTLNAEG